MDVFFVGTFKIQQLKMNKKIPFIVMQTGVLFNFLCHSEREDFLVIIWVE